MPVCVRLTVLFGASAVAEYHGGKQEVPDAWEREHSRGRGRRNSDRDRDRDGWVEGER